VNDPTLLEMATALTVAGYRRQRHGNHWRAIWWPITHRQPQSVRSNQYDRKSILRTATGRSTVPYSAAMWREMTMLLPDSPDSPKP
jgi:hypothetical protein